MIVNFLLSEYDTVIAFDGKNISSILLFIIRSKYKYIFLYKKKVNSFFFNIFCKILRKFNVNYFILNNRDLIENGSDEHYPTKFSSLKENFGIFDDKTYYLEDLKPTKNIIINEKFILMHLDEKFADITNINEDFTDLLKLFSRKINYKVILTSFNNNHDYFKNLDLKKIPFNNLNQINLSELKLFILEDIPLNNFYDLIKRSSLNISCHAGFLVHASLLNNKETIDILNEKDETWLNTWITKNNAYSVIYKSKKNKKLSIREIFNNLMIKINEL